MKSPAISRFERRPTGGERGERGVTIVLVAAAMVAIMAMAALSIDAVTLYLANTEAQRSADAAALAGARILSISGMTGDPEDTTGNWAAACQMAILVAKSVANQNVVGGAAPSTVNVTFPNDPSGNCSDVGVATVFGVNPIVQVQVQRGNLPTFFARIWGHTGTSVSGTATAEAFNASNSSSYAGSVIGVQPRCVKPWIVANGPAGGGYVNPTDGAITNAGMSPGGVIGSVITLQPATGCNAFNCYGVEGAMVNKNQYLAASVQGTPVAVNSGATGDAWQQAIGGCDQTTVYACGTGGGASAELNANLGTANGDSYTATEALINAAGGSDSINPGLYPFQIRAGAGNPLVTNGIVNDDDVITTSNSIVTVPLMDSTIAVPHVDPAPVTIVGYLQLFITQVNNGTVGPPPTFSTMQGTVLNVVGCTNTSPPTSVTGSSPVPVRLIQPVP